MNVVTSFLWKGFAHNRFNSKEEYLSAIKYREGEHVEYGEINANNGKDEEEHLKS